MRLPIDSSETQLPLERHINGKVAVRRAARNRNTHAVAWLLHPVPLAHHDRRATEANLLVCEIRLGTAGDHIHQLAEGIGEVVTLPIDWRPNEGADDFFRTRHREAQHNDPDDACGWRKPHPGVCWVLDDRVRHSFVAASGQLTTRFCIGLTPLLRSAHTDSAQMQIRTHWNQDLVGVQYSAEP